jgi:hypothetical protein
VSAVPGGFRVRPVSGAVLLASIVFAAAGLAANLRDVRVGPHGEYTRVVLETDAKASYSVTQTAQLVTIELQASAAPKALAAKSQQLSWVRIEPQGDSSVVRIELKGPARLKQMVLSGPNRIVLDVYGDGAATTIAPQPAPPPEREVLARTPSDLPQPAPQATETAVALDAEEALVHQEADALLGPAPDAVPGDEIAAAEGTPSEGAPLHGESTTPPLPTSAAPSEVAPAKPVVVKREKGVLDWLQEPWVLAGLAIVMVGLVVILRRRRPLTPTPAAASQHEEDSAASLFATPAGEEQAAQAVVGASASGLEAETVGYGTPSEEAEPSAESRPSDDAASAFEFEAPEVDPDKPEVGPAQGVTLSTIGAVTSTAAYEPQPPIASGGLNLAELERRLALLEQRLEEVIDAKDRLERQVSAQTEELRVQRAAIARTQRVLRTVVRPEDDQASEPVLKS